MWPRVTHCSEVNVTVNSSSTSKKVSGKEAGKQIQVFCAYILYLPVPVKEV